MEFGTDFSLSVRAFNGYGQLCGRSSNILGYPKVIKLLLEATLSVCSSSDGHPTLFAKV